MSQPPFEHLVERQEELDRPYDRPVVYLRLTLRDGTIRHEGPYSRWVADMLLGSGVFMSSDVAEALIEPVADYEEWVDG